SLAKGPGEARMAAWLRADSKGRDAYMLRPRRPPAWKTARNGAKSCLADGADHPRVKTLVGEFCGVPQKSGSCAASVRFAQTRGGMRRWLSAIRRDSMAASATAKGPKRAKSARSAAIP